MDERAEAMSCGSKESFRIFGPGERRVAQCLEILFFCADPHAFLKELEKRAAILVAIHLLNQLHLVLMEIVLETSLATLTWLETLDERRGSSFPCF